MNFLSDKEERAATYRLLAGVFLRQPDEETFETLRLSYKLEVKDSLDAAVSEFASVFRLLPPYESVYFNPGERAGIVADVHAFYESEGVMLDRELGLPADHLGVELLFMSYLIENERLEAQRKFLERHILRWTPSYLDTLGGSANGMFYKSMTSFTKGFLISDYERFFE